MDSTRKHNLTTTNRSITSNTMDTKDSLGRRKKNVIKPNWPKNKVNKLKKTTKKIKTNPPSHPIWSPALTPGTAPHCLAHHWRVRCVPRSTAPQVIVQSSHFLDENFQEEISSSRGLRGLLIEEKLLAFTHPFWKRWIFGLNFFNHVLFVCASWVMVTGPFDCLSKSIFSVFTLRWFCTPSDLPSFSQ